MATEDGPIPISTAIIALAIEIRALRRVVEYKPIPTEAVGGSDPYPDDL